MEFIKEYMDELEKEREALVAQWKAEFEAEQRELEAPLMVTIYKLFLGPCVESIMSMLATVEVFLANLPLTIGAVGLSWVTMGTVWFKYMEENVDFCNPVHFYSPRCTFPEFPGCFECDTSERLYQIAVNWHFFCSFVAGVCCVLFLLKVVVAWRIVVDELGNPTTSTPMGVVCIAVVCVFAGQGPVGEAIVIGTSCFHFLLAFWFLYTAIYRFRLWPDPGWFPNTVGISYAAVKTYLYFPMPGLVMLSVSDARDVKHGPVQSATLTSLFLKALSAVFLYHILYQCRSRCLEQEDLSPCRLDWPFCSQHHVVCFHFSLPANSTQGGTVGIGFDIPVEELRMDGRVLPSLSTLFDDPLAYRIGVCCTRLCYPMGPLQDQAL
jgi:hypothetical protein